MARLPAAGVRSCRGLREPISERRRRPLASLGLRVGDWRATAGLAIVFAGVYRVLDKLGDASHFSIHGVVRDITYAESLYFSIITMATVGYGDITPVTNVARLIAAVEVVLGVLLLLFGFSEIMSYMRERRGPRGEP